VLCNLDIDLVKLLLQINNETQRGHIGP